MTAIWMILALVLGSSVAFQGAVNSSLSSRIGVGQTLLVNTLVVALGTIIVLVVTSKPANLAPGHMLQGPWYEYMGGVLGFLVIFLAMSLFPRLGAGLTLTLAIAAQLIVAVAIDHFALLGVPAHPATPARLAGVALLIAGAVIVKLT